jgi:DNA-directed RNA polymerase specialized sigma24 family protein
MCGDNIDPAEAAILRGSAPRGPSDQELVNGMARGDQNALRELMLRHRGRVQRFTARFLQDRDRIDDVVNDVFVAVWRQARAFEQRASVVTWLLAIAKFRAMSAHSEASIGNAKRPSTRRRRRRSSIITTHRTS